MSLPKANQRVGGNESAKDGGKDGAACPSPWGGGIYFEKLYTPWYR